MVSGRIGCAPRTSCGCENGPGMHAPALELLEVAHQRRSRLRTAQGAVEEGWKQRLGGLVRHERDREALGLAQERGRSSEAEHDGGQRQADAELRVRPPKAPDEARD